MEETAPVSQLSSIPSSQPSDPYEALKANLIVDLKGHTAPLPTIDFSDLNSDSSDRRSKTCGELLKACEEWGFFFLVNHGISEEKIKTMIKAGKEFFRLPEDEKNQYTNDLYAMKYGRDDIVYTTNRKFYLWRDSLKLHLNPSDFHLPHEPRLLREAVVEYSGIVRELTKKLMEAVTDALELDKRKMHRMLKMDEGFQILILNYYPPCPQPDQNLGMPPHTDLGLFSYLIDNGVLGLQVQKDGQWFNVAPPQENCILVNVADFLQIYSNGRCKSVKHRASTNNEKERLSFVMTDGPSLNAMVGPATEHERLLYPPRTYADYMVTKYQRNPMHCE